MKTRILMIFVFAFAIGFVETAFAELDTSILEPFENNDLVIVGSIVDINTVLSENKTQYSIKIEEFLKGKASFDMVTAILDEIRPVDFPNTPLDYYNKPFFDKENQVLVYFKKKDGIYKMSPYSFTIKKPSVAGPPTVIHPTGPQGHFFLQGDEITISGTVKKGYLYGLGQSGLNSTFYLSVLNEKEKHVESKKIEILPDGSYELPFQKKGELRIPGKYSWEITFENGNMGGEFVVMPDWDRWTPLKQIKSGVSLIDVECNEDKVKVIKYDRMRAACVSEETRDELWGRGWATMRFYTEEDTSSYALCNNYEGKWHPEYEGCRGEHLTDLQCSLMGGKFVDDLKICHNNICPDDKTYTLCVTNPELIPREKDNED